jgi:Fuc2NAc and GlcNAc transferase
MLFAVVMAGLGGLITGLALRYARSRQLIDQPGLRRSHQQPTPRGGGLGFVIPTLMLLPLLAALAEMPWLTASAVAFGGVALAGIGLADDHHDLPARWRLIVQLSVGCVLLAALGLPEVLELKPVTWPPDSLWQQSLLAVVLLLALVWMINLTNFMDGSNGLVAIAVAFSGLTLGGLNAVAGEHDIALLGVGLSAAVLGFLPWNFPSARVFMGDVGSTVAGFFLAFIILESQRRQSVTLAVGLLSIAPMAADATLTVLKRAWKRRRLARAHREHLYQLLIRGGFSHAEVALGQLLVLLLIVAPLMALSWLHSVPGGLALLLFSLGFAVLWQTCRMVFWRRRGRLRRQEPSS